MGTFFLLWHALGSGPFSILANTIQNATGVGGALMWKLHNCRVPWCFRIGQHEVRGTTWKVCKKHHVKQQHVILRLRHRNRHPERMQHGES